MKSFLFVRRRHPVTAAAATACVTPVARMLPFSPQLLGLGAHEEVESVIIRGRQQNFDEKPKSEVYRYRSCSVAPTANAQFRQKFREGTFFADLVRDLR